LLSGFRWRNTYAIGFLQPLCGFALDAARAGEADEADEALRLWLSRLTFELEFADNSRAALMTRDATTVEEDRPHRFPGRFLREQ